MLLCSNPYPLYDCNHVFKGKLFRSMSFYSLLFQSCTNGTAAASRVSTQINKYRVYFECSLLRGCVSRLNILTVLYLLLFFRSIKCLMFFFLPFSAPFHIPNSAVHTFTYTSDFSECFVRTQFVFGALVLSNIIYGFLFIRFLLLFDLNDFHLILWNKLCFYRTHSISIRV